MIKSFMLILLLSTLALSQRKVNDHTYCYPIHDGYIALAILEGDTSVYNNQWNVSIKKEFSYWGDHAGAYYNIVYTNKCSEKCSCPYGGLEYYGTASVIIDYDSKYTLTISPMKLSEAELKRLTDEWEKNGYEWGEND